MIEIVIIIFHDQIWRSSVVWVFTININNCTRMRHKIIFLLKIQGFLKLIQIITKWKVIHSKNVNKLMQMIKCNIKNKIKSYKQTHFKNNTSYYVIIPPKHKKQRLKSHKAAPTINKDKIAPVYVENSWYVKLIHPDNILTAA